MSLDLFSDNKYYKLDELHKRYQAELYEYLKERKFILSNKHYLTRWSNQGTIAITMFESRCVDDSNYPNREEWHEFSVYQIEFVPHNIRFRFNEDYNDDKFNIEEIKSDYNLFIEVREYLKDLFKRYKTEYKKIKEQEAWMYAARKLKWCLCD